MVAGGESFMIAAVGKYGLAAALLAGMMCCTVAFLQTSHCLATACIGVQFDACLLKRDKG